MVLVLVGGAVAFVMPVYQDKADRRNVGQAVATAVQWRDAIDAQYAKSRVLPSKPADLGPVLPPAGDPEGYGTVDLGANGALVVTLTSKMDGYASKTVIFKASPNAAGAKLEWDCTGGTLKAKVRPAFCQ